MTAEILDARGVPIGVGNTVIYGFGVGRSIAMAEAIVLGDTSPSLTPSGRVRLKVVRRSYSDGEKPTVDVAPDRLVVLYQSRLYRGYRYLPESPLPTQTEVVRQKHLEEIERYTEYLHNNFIAPWAESHFESVASFHAYVGKRLAEVRKKLKVLEEYDDELSDHHG